MSAVRTSVVPNLIDALLAAAEEPVVALGARVVDGYGVSDDPADALFVGVDDPFSSSRASSADTAQGVATAGTQRPREETGSIQCAALATDGTPSQKIARDKAYAIAEALATLVRNASGPGVATPPFGVTGLLSVGFGEHSTLYQNQTDKGADALLIFDVTFTARI